MKPNKFKVLAPAFMMAVACLASLNGISQERKLPDGTIVYGDGTRKLPNGTVIYKGGTVGNGGNNGTSVTLPDGSVVLPDGRRTYPNNDKTYKNRKGKALPPGQAKKIYGGSAKDYAPGQQNKNNKQKQWKGNNHKGKGKK